jgi:hypothetical protein
VDPLVRLDQAEQQGTIPRAIAKKTRDKVAYLTKAVQRVERASGLPYPPYYVEPVLPVSGSGAEFGQLGVLFARVIPTTVTGSLSIIVQFTAALVAFGTKGTIEAVTAHEFTHYVDLVRRVSRTNLLSDERSSTLFESGHADPERTVPPKLLFGDRALVALISRKFKGGLTDEKLNKLVEEKWIAKNLPLRSVGPDENIARVDMASIAKTKFDPRVLQKISQMEEKMMTP